MACGRQNNSCGCGNNNDWNQGNGCNNCFIGNRGCRRELRRAIETIKDIEDLADDFLDDFFNCHGGCGCCNRNDNRCDRDNRDRRDDRGDRDDRDRCDDRGDRDDRCRCDCGCDNYWGR